VKSCARAARERFVAGAPEGGIAACGQDLGVDLRLRLAAALYRNLLGGRLLL
jgi:hypothetical protein